MPGYKTWDADDRETREEGPDGLILRLSKDSSTGYLNVVKVREKYHAKVKGVGSSVFAPQRTLPGGGCATARDAAIRLARYYEDPELLPPKAERRPRGQGKVCARSLCLSCATHA